ncbi:MAG: hypothetical protein HY782_20795 [Chloroflexi bacterium]|nr:hypothetical protein [Chloroflexota bacterium]
MSHLLARLYTSLRSEPPKSLSADGTRPRSAILLVIAVVLTFFWQRTFEYAGSRLDLTYRTTVTAGLFGQDAFYYFYHYLGLFPVYAEGIAPIYSQSGAESILRDHPEALRTERGYVIRSGDLGKVWLYGLDAWLKGEPRDVSAAEFTKWFFVLGLIGILVAMWYADQFLLGLLMVVFIGSHPFQLYEVYADNVPGAGQVFSILISTALVGLAFHVPLIFDRRLPKWYLYVLPVLTGIFFGTVRQVRNEPTVLLLSVVACYALVAGVNRRAKFAMILFVLLAFGIASQTWNYYWDAKIRQSYAVVTQHGGQPYTGELTRTHIFWHPLWAGLGDFGQKYGYAWDDVAAYDYATPILKREGAIDYAMIGTEKSTAWYDERQLYFKMIWTQPRYEEVLRDKVVGDILRDPAWYLEVLARRVWRILTKVAPARVAVGANWITLPLSGILLIPTLLVLILLRRWTLVKLLGFVLPLAVTAFVIYSGSGFTYYSIYPQVLAAIYLTALWGGLRWVLRRAGGLRGKYGTLSVKT